MKYTVKVLSSMFVIAISFSFFCFTEYCRDISASVIRIHVIADSNSEEAQSVKLKVRDSVLEELKKINLNNSSYADSLKKITLHIPELKKAADGTLKSHMADYNANIRLCRESYPVRNYESFTLPSGEYSSLQITLGSGKGKNWWCVIYPELCSSLSVDDSAFSDEEKNILEKPEEYRVSLKLLEILEKIKKCFSC